MVENAFGIMAARCFVLRGPILQSYPNALKTAKACVVFHNYTLEKLPPPSSKSDREQDDIPSGLLGVQATTASSRGTHQARLMSERLADHFMGEGQVTFQWGMAFASSRQMK